MSRREQPDEVLQREHSCPLKESYAIRISDGGRRIGPVAGKVFAYSRDEGELVE